MLNNLFVSVIMPAFNADEYIGEAIKSVLTQTHANLELLIINDGSEDHTEARALSFNDQRIRYFFQANKGVSAARNIGLANMRGEFFCFLDADDIMPSDSISSRLKVFLQDSSLSFVDGKVLIRDISLRYVIREYQPSFSGSPYNELLNLSEKCFFGPSWMIRRHTDQTYQFQEGLTHGEDLLFYLSIAHQGLYASTTEEVLWYRTGNTSAMNNLKGLEKGYAHIYSSIRFNYHTSIRQRLYLKYKITRIMVLSYLSIERNPLNALLVLARYSIL